MIEPLEIRLKVETQSVEKARRAAADFAANVGVSPKPVAAAVSEAVSSAVLEGLRNGGGGSILIRGEVNDDETLVIAVEDDSVGRLADTRQGGNGMMLSLIAAIADVMKIERASEGGTRILIGFDLPRSRVTS